MKLQRQGNGAFLSPELYHKIQTVIEQAFMYDFNMIIDDFDFYFKLPPKMQTELVESLFGKFKKDFAHFFDPCETGFTNEVIVNLKAFHLPQNFEILSPGCKIDTLYFITDGIVQIVGKGMAYPFLVLPKYSYFGDFQILFGLKSMFSCKVYNLPENNRLTNDEISKKGLPILKANQSSAKNINMMTIEAENFLRICELYPRTLSHLRRRALER